MRKKLVALMCAFTMITSPAYVVNADENSDSAAAETESSDSEARIKEIKEEIAALEKELAELEGSGKQDDETQEITIGETVTADSCEFTLVNVEIVKDVYPSDTSGYYHYYPSESGNVYLHIDADVKNTQKETVDCDTFYTAEANYNNGYIYQGTSIVEENSTTLTDASWNQIAPLQTMGIHYIFECPEEIENSDLPLFIIITIDKQEYKYTVR